MKHIIKILAFLMVFIIMLSSLCSAAENETEGTAVTSVESTAMRLIRTEGSVSLTEEDDTPVPVQLNMRLFSGNTIATELESRAGISLDESKAATVGELSQTEIRQDGKKLVMELDHGEMYFSVTSPLSEDESFEINVSNMTLGIRGTAGYLSIEDDSKCSIILTCGIATLKVSEEISIPILPGQIYTIENEEEGIQIKNETLTVGAMPDLLVEELALDTYALERTKAESRLDTDALSSRIAGLPYEENIPAGTSSTCSYYGIDGSITYTHEMTSGHWYRDKYVYTTDSPDVLVEVHYFCYIGGPHIEGNNDINIIGELYYDISFIYTMSDSHNYIRFKKIGPVEEDSIYTPIEGGTYYSDLEVIIEEYNPHDPIENGSEQTIIKTTNLEFEDAWVQVIY